MTVSGAIEKIDVYECTIVMRDKTKIPIEEVYGIEIITKLM